MWWAILLISSYSEQQEVLEFIISEAHLENLENVFNSFGGFDFFLIISELHKNVNNAPVILK